MVTGPASPFIGWLFESGSFVRAIILRWSRNSSILHVKEFRKTRQSDPLQVMGTAF